MLSFDPSKFVRQFKYDWYLKEILKSEALQMKAPIGQ